MSLLGGRYAPITECLGFLHADFEAVVKASQRWRLSLGGYKGQRVRGSLSELLEMLLPLTGPGLRHMWIRAEGGWTMYVDNFVGGSDPFGPIAYLARTMRCRGLTVSDRAGTEKRGWGIGFSIYGWEETDWLNVIRSVSANEDDGWRDSGAVQGFEEVEQYKNRRVRDRLTSSMIERYCVALGLPRLDESFAASEGYLVTNSNSLRPGKPIRTETLQQARAAQGLV